MAEVPMNRAWILVALVPLASCIAGGRESPIGGPRGSRVAPSPRVVEPSSAPAPTGGADPVVKLRSGRLRLEAWGDRIIRVVYEDSARPTSASLAVVQPRSTVPVSVHETDGELVLATAALQASVDKRTERVTFQAPSGRAWAAEHGRALIPTTLAGSPSHSAAQSFVIDPDEHIYGLGQHQTGKLSYNGLSTTLMQKNTEIGIPMLVSSKGYGILWDNPSITTVDVGLGETIPAQNLIAPDGTPGGLVGQYFDGTFETLRATRTDGPIDFTWPDVPADGVGADSFSVRWRGSIQTLAGGVYTFSTLADDGVRLWIDNKLLIDDWEVHAPTMRAASIELRPNARYPVRLEFFDRTQGARIQLAWIPPGKQGALDVRSEVADRIDYYFIVGPELDDVIGGYRALTGDAPLFARYAWGYWQSKEHYSTADELLGTVREYRKRRIPIDGIVQDWFYWNPEPWGSHLWDHTRYPDPSAMFEEAHRNNVHVLLSVWAKFEPGSDNYRALQGVGALLEHGAKGQMTYYDPFSEVGRTTYWQQLNDQLFAKGVDAWWLDATEPELHASWGEFREYGTAQGPGARVFNAYPLMTTRAVYEGQRAVSDKRVLILTRSAYAGQQRNAAVSWSGDIEGDWATFKKQIPAGLNFSMSGIPYWNTDIGGFFPGFPVKSPAYRELYLRWFEYAAFCPMFRSHGTGGDKEQWRFGPAAERILLDTDRLRYRLLPYIYSTAWEVTHARSTMMRALAFDFRSDPSALDVADQFMFGSALLVNPVTTAQRTQRAVYLPRNAVWYDFWTGERHAGGHEVTAKAPIGRIPLFARGGSIVPLGPSLQYTTEKPCDPIELRIYAGANGRFDLYEDDNDGYAYEKGRYAVIPIEWNDAASTVTIGARTGSFPGMLSRRTFRLVLVRASHGASTEPAPPDRVVEYDGSEVSVRVQ